MPGNIGARAKLEKKEYVLVKKQIINVRTGSPKSYLFLGHLRNSCSASRSENRAYFAFVTMLTKSPPPLLWGKFLLFLLGLLHLAPRLRPSHSSGTVATFSVS